MESTAANPLEIRDLMSRFRSGDSDAAGHLVNIFYTELRKIGAARMRQEAPGHSWGPTALVNELYIELVKIRQLREAAEGSDERAEFLALAGFIMRRLLIHHSRPLSKRAKKVDTQALDTVPRHVPASSDGLLEVERLLDRLGLIDPKLRAVVEMRVFEGRTLEEIAEASGCSVRTVQHRWSFAKRWLESELH